MTDPVPGELPAGLRMAPAEASLWSPPPSAPGPTLGRAVVRSRPVAVVGRSGGPGRDRRPPRLARCSGPFPRAGPGPRGLRRGAPIERLHWPRSSPGWAAAASPRGAPRTFGDRPTGSDLHVLDSTDPEAVGAIVDDLDPLSTLFIVASKSGTTTEPLAFQADAWARIQAALDARHEHREQPGSLMAAITDPGTSLEAIPHHDDLREVFLNPPDIGGRYSALTYVGLVPASLIGLSVGELLPSAAVMLERCRAPEPADNPGLALGLALGALALAAPAGAGATRSPSSPIRRSHRSGSWLEQLIAESTGKQGVGIVPVDLEPLGAAAAYGPDRVFVRLALAGSAGPAPAPDGTTADALLEQLAAAGHPVIRIELADPIDIGGEFFRWEVATAIAGVVLGIDAFDQPNVEEAKVLTRELLAGHEQTPDRRRVPRSPRIRPTCSPRATG